MRPDTLVVEISGKRPGTSAQRPTERFRVEHDHVIISNNADDYITDWKIVMVPDDFREWYCEKYRHSDTAWYAPMNRSYAIKYARDHGYKYLVQLDDNIDSLHLESISTGKDGISKRYRAIDSVGMMDDFIEMLVCVLENTNAGMAGCGMAGCSNPTNDFLRERYVYSLFALDLSICADIFHGDFEDDIEYRLKLGQMGIPAVQVVPLRYSKPGQVSSKDETGNRAAYTAAGVKRGEHMRLLYGDKYKCGMRSRTNGTAGATIAGTMYFKHILTPWKVGVLVHDRDAMNRKLQEIYQKNAKPYADKYILREKKVKNGKTT